MDAIIQFYPIQFYPLIIAYNFHSIIIVMTCYNPLRWPEKGYEWRFTKIARTTPNPPHSHLVHPCSGDRNDSPCCSTAPGHRSTKGEKKRWNTHGQSLTVKNVSIFCWWWLLCFWLLPIYSQKTKDYIKYPSSRSGISQVQPAQTSDGHRQHPGIEEQVVVQIFGEQFQGSVI